MESKHFCEQECITVGCVPSATVAVRGGGGCIPASLGRGMSGHGGGLAGGVSAWGRCLPREVSGGGCLAGVGVCHTLPSPYTESQTPVKT